jgi:hypothetical protein
MTDGRPSSPIGLRILMGVHLDTDYYIDDNPEKHTTFTYVIYGYDNEGHFSFPVVVKAALPEIGDNMKTGTKTE